VAARHLLPVPAIPALALPRGQRAGHMARITADAAQAKKPAIAGRIAAGVKTCSKCRRQLGYHQFGSNKAEADHYDCYCRPCRRQWQREQAAKRKAAALAVAAEMNRDEQAVLEAADAEDWELLASVRTGVVWRLPPVNAAAELR
jgi:hypothetical protein